MMSSTPDTDHSQYPLVPDTDDELTDDGFVDIQANSDREKERLAALEQKLRDESAKANREKAEFEQFKQDKEKFGEFVRERQKFDEFKAEQAALQQFKRELTEFEEFKRERAAFDEFKVDRAALQQYKQEKTEFEKFKREKDEFEQLKQDKVKLEKQLTQVKRELAFLRNDTFLLESSQGYYSRALTQSEQVRLEHAASARQGLAQLESKLATIEKDKTREQSLARFKHSDLALRLSESEKSKLDLLQRLKKSENENKALLRSLKKSEKEQSSLQKNLEFNKKQKRELLANLRTTESVNLDVFERLYAVEKERLAIQSSLGKAEQEKLSVLSKLKQRDKEKSAAHERIKQLEDQNNSLSDQLMTSHLRELALETERRGVFPNISTELSDLQQSLARSNASLEQTLSAVDSSESNVETRAPQPRNVQRTLQPRKTRQEKQKAKEEYADVTGNRNRMFHFEKNSHRLGPTTHGVYIKQPASRIAWGR